MLHVRPTKSIELPMMTKCFADKSFIRNPVARIVKLERIVKRFDARFIVLPVVFTKIGSKMMLNVVANAVLKI
jgi:hypothetical protein